jgi:hypothetical protein
MATEHPAGDREPQGLSIIQVRRWVVSALIVSVTLFPLGALTAAIHYRADDDRAGAIILTVMMAIIGVAATAAVHLVHQRSLWSPYLALGTVAAVGSAVWTWGVG